MAARQMARSRIALAGALALAGCSYAQVTPDFPEAAKSLNAETFECCWDPEKYYPDPIVRLGMGIANEVGPTLAAAAYGDYEETEYPGLLTGKAEARAAVMRELRPFDILLVTNHSYQIGRLMPGRFSHSVVYVGTERELRAAGLWTIPALVPWHDEIRAGKTMLEAAYPDVHFITPEKTFEVDQVLAIRPVLSAAEKRVALERMLAVMGKPYNFQLGIDPTGERYACTGLIYHAMPELGFTVRDVYGQKAVMPDDVAAQAVRGERLHPVIYVAGTETGYTKRSLWALMVEVASYWGIPGRDG